MNPKKLFAVLFLTVTLVFSAFSADRALIIGIDNYQSSDVSPVRGAVADAKGAERLIVEKFGFKPHEIRVLTENQATTFNIRENVKNWLIKDSKAGDRIFFFYSGHGARVLDQDGDEEDGRDEVIAPFDLDFTVQGNNFVPRNFIRDDEINEWIAALYNRQLVMIFDSCNSGTLSRSDNKPSKFLNLESVTKKNRSFSDEQWSPKSKDLTPIVDRYMNNKTPNAVIISASQPNQTAAWFDTNGSLCSKPSPSANYRGALAYLFEKAFQNSNPTLSQLSDFLTSEMQKLQENKIMCQTNPDFQKPFLEFNSSKTNQTLWGTNNNSRVKPTYENSIIASLSNPLSKIRVNLKFNSHNNSYKIGEKINYAVTLGEEAFLYVVVFSQNNVATVVYPYSADKNNLKQAGTSNFTADAQEPLGKDVWVAIAAKQRIPGLENLPDNRQFSWDEVYQKIGVAELEKNLQEIAKTRGAGSPDGKLKSSEWQTASAVMITLPK